MTLQAIKYGAAANDGTGDSLREAMRKTQQNFEYLDQGKADRKKRPGQRSEGDAKATSLAITQVEQVLEGKVTAEAGKSLMTNAGTRSLLVSLQGRRSMHQQTWH
jgi:hypothetical protein